MVKYQPEDDIEYLRKYFEQLNEEIVPSHRISPEILLQKLNDTPELTVKRVWFTPRRIAAVVCAGLVVCVALFYADLPKRAPTTAMNTSGSMEMNMMMDEAPASAEAAPFSDDYIAVREALALAAENTVSEYDALARQEEREGKGGAGSETGGYSEGLTASIAAETADLSAKRTDAIQADDDYLFYAAGTSAMIAQTKTDGSLSLVSEIKVSGDDRFVTALYQEDNVLTLLCNDYDFTVPQTDPSTGTVNKIQSVGTTALVYDITDPSAPVLIREFTQEGAYRSSLVADETLYLVSERETFSYTDSMPIESLVPVVSDTAWGGTPKLIESGNIILPEKPNDASYVVVSALSLNDNGAQAATRAVLGGAKQIYCTPGGVYMVTPAGEKNKPASDLLKLTLAEDNTIQTASARLWGQVIGLETGSDDGIYVVAEGTNEQSGIELCATVYNKFLAIKESTTSVVDRQADRVYFASGTAYIGEEQTGSVIAVCDFTATEKPAFSKPLEQMTLPKQVIPLSDTLSLGIDPADLSAGGKGLTVTLYGISGSTITTFSTTQIGESGSFTEALCSAYAVMYDKDTNLLGIPVIVTERTDGQQVQQKFSGYYLYQIANGKLKLAGKVENQSTQPEDVFRRGVLVNGLLYMASDTSLASVDSQTLSVIDTLTWHE